jgi:hypothetical protein
MKPIFNTDIEQLSQQQLPTFLRGGAVLGALLRAAILPVAMNHERLLRLLADTEDAMGYTGQAFSLQRMLNDYYDPMMRRITVNGVPNGEGRFTVCIPAGFKDDFGTENSLRANIDKHKLITSQYEIQWT